MTAVDGSPAGGDPVPFVVHHVGAQSVVTAGDLSARLDLASLHALPGLYGIGPLDRLTGEVTILDGRPHIATVADSAISISHALEGGVPFFVWTQVSTWDDHPVPEGARDFTEIQSFIKRTATDSGIDTDRAFPFLLVGTPEWVDFHVWESAQVDTATGVTERSTRVPFQLEDRPLHMIGFYSEQDRGIFIPNDSFVHVHLCTDDGAASGHLDQARWGPGMTLRLPSPGPAVGITTARG